MLNIYELVSLTISLLSVYLIFFIIIWGNRYLKVYSKNKKLKFTQEEIRQRRKEIADLKKNIAEQEMLCSRENFPWEFEGNTQLQYIFEVFSLYNELAVGINAGIYDELYIKMVMGNQISVFYKKYYHRLMATFNKDTFFMPLELLLKRWDEEGSTYNISKWRYK